METSDLYNRLKAKIYDRLEADSQEEGQPLSDRNLATMGKLVLDMLKYEGSTSSKKEEDKIQDFPKMP